MTKMTVENLILLAEKVGLCYKPCVTMKSVLIYSALAVMLLSGQVCAAPDDEAVNGEEAAETISPAAIQAVEAANAQLEALMTLLCRIVDADSAAQLAPQVVAAYECLRNIDMSAFAEDDEEMLAAEFANDVYIKVAEEMLRLADASFYGNVQLQTLLDTAETLEEDAPAEPRQMLPSAAEAPAREAATESLLPH